MGVANRRIEAAFAKADPVTNKGEQVLVEGATEYRRRDGTPYTDTKTARSR